MSNDESANLPDQTTERMAADSNTPFIISAGLPVSVPFELQSEMGEISTAPDAQIESTRSSLSSYPANMYMTMEVKPSHKNYMFDSMNSRPSLRLSKLSPEDVLSKVHEQNAAIDALMVDKNRQDRLKTFGTFNGVVGRCLLNIWGVILFLRLGWVVGHAGILHTSIIILLSLLLTLVTAFSMSAICTNGEIGGGGTYYLVSRALGPEWGASVGIIFSIANAVALSLYLVGFAETIVSLSNFSITGSSMWDMRFIGVSALVFLTVVCIIGVGWVVKLDAIQLLVLVTAIALCMIGTISSAPQPELAFTGYSSSTFSNNWYPDYRDGETFISVFSVFFPAVTGMLAGANISGELKDAQKSIPIGTISAVLISTTVYMSVSWMLGATVLRDSLTNDESGLFLDYLILPKISVWAPFVYIGIFASTLSSALASLVGAPRILMAVCNDGMFPQINYFAVSRKRDNEPVRGYMLVFLIGIAFVMIGRLNTIAPIITQFFLFNRVLINYACFEAAWSKSPSWRPTFKWYSPTLSLFCAVCCVALMFAINWWAALTTLSVGLMLHQYVKIKSPGVNFGEARRGVVFNAATQNLLTLQTIPQHVKTWRPLYLVLSTNEQERSRLLEFTDHMRSGHGLLYDGNVTVGDFDDIMAGQRKIDKSSSVDNHHVFVKALGRRTTSMSIRDPIERRSYFKETVVSANTLDGWRVLMQTAGVNGIRPNVVLVDTASVKPTPETGLMNESSCELLFRAFVSAMQLRYSLVALRGTLSEPIQDGNIDVYWLADTGGITLLLPHLLCQHKLWNKSSMRVFLHGEQGQFDQADAEIVRLMKMLRIDVSHVEHINLFQNPKDESWKGFEDVDNSSEHYVKMSHFLRLNESMREQSAESNVVFVTLPLPLPSKYSAKQYSQCLNAITKQLPFPVVFVRGNQQGVLSVQA